jgi:hypothetical protein
VVNRRHFIPGRQGFDAEGYERAATLPAPLFLLELKELSGVIAHGLLSEEDIGRASKYQESGLFGRTFADTFGLIG